MKSANQPTPTPLWKELSPAQQKEILAGMKLPTRPLAPMGKPQDKPNAFAFQGFVRCDLAKTDVDAFLNWRDALTPEVQLDEVVKSIHDGYSLKLTLNKDAYQASLSAVTTERDWEGYVLTAFASDPAAVLALLYYKHTVLLERNWMEATQTGGENYMR